MPQRPNTDGAVGTALDSSSLNWAFIIRLDIDTDPLHAWTGFGDLTFAAGETGDSALDGMTFQGITHLVAEVGAVQDAQGGSNALEITVPGVDLTDEAMRQVVYDRRKWQFLPGRVWLLLLDDDGNKIGKPIRLKSGRMDQMPVEEGDNGEGTIRCVIEGHQAYGGMALATRYSEQDDIDPTDTSQKWVWQLANMTPALGQPHSLAGGGGSPATPGSGGSPSARETWRGRGVTFR